MSDKLEQFPLKHVLAKAGMTPVERSNCDQNKELELRSDSIGSGQALAEGAWSSDFSFLAAIRSTWREPCPALPPPLKRKKKRGLRRIMREIARLLFRRGGLSAKAAAPGARQ